MKAWACAAFLVGTLVSVGAGAISAPPPPLYGELVPASYDEYMRHGTKLARLDPPTLAPLGRTLAVRLEWGEPVARSPDGRFVALAWPKTGAPKLRIVDLENMRFVRTVTFGGERWRLRAVSWPAADRIVILAQLMRGPNQEVVDERQVVIVDPQARSVVSRVPFANERSVLASESVGGKLVLLLGRGDGKLAPFDLVVVEAGGTVRASSLDPLWPAGSHPWLVVDRTGAHAFVGASTTRVATVELDTLSVAVHEVEGGARVFAARSGPGPRWATWRWAIWAGEGKLAVTGSNTARAGKIFREVPAGLALVDTTTWRAQQLDSSSTIGRASAGTIVATGSRVESGIPPTERPRLVGLGMRAYDVTGRLLWRRFAGQAPALVPYRGYTQVILTPQPQWQPFTPGPPGFGRPVLTYVLDARSGQTIALQRSRGIVRLLPDPAA